MKKISTYYFMAVGLLSLGLLSLLSSLTGALVELWTDADVMLPGLTQAFLNGAVCRWPLAFCILSIAAIVISATSRIRNSVLMHGVVAALFLLVIGSTISLLVLMLPFFKMGEVATG
jgi:hypothetical protein